MPGGAQARLLADGRAVGIRLHRRQEMTGGDLSEIGLKAYNLS